MAVAENVSRGLATSKAEFVAVAVADDTTMATTGSVAEDAAAVLAMAKTMADDVTMAKTEAVSEDVAENVSQDVAEDMSDCGPGYFQGRVGGQRRGGRGDHGEGRGGGMCQRMWPRTRLRLWPFPR